MGANLHPRNIVFLVIKFVMDLQNFDFKARAVLEMVSYFTDMRNDRNTVRVGFFTNEPPHDKTNKMACAQRRLRSGSSLSAQWVAKDPRFLHTDSEDSGQTWRMPRLTRVFAGRTNHFVGFVMRRLKLLRLS